MSRPKARVKAGRAAIVTGDESNRVLVLPLSDIRPAVVNDAVYKPVSPDAPDIQKLAADIKSKGLLQPIDVTRDNVILSGHRRRVACLLAGLDLAPVRRHDILSDDPEFERFLVSFNLQRVKSVQEQIREEIIRTSPEDAQLELFKHRIDVSTEAHMRVLGAGLRVLTPTAARKRSEITGAKKPMLDAAVTVLDENRAYWPLTLRQVHYRLLTRNVQRNAKTDTKYDNTQASYKDLSDLLVRARQLELVPWESIHDPTRPRTTWRQWDGAAEFVRAQLDGFLRNYKRNLIQSQPAYIELVVEKITVQDITERAAARFHVPVGVGRGYTSATSLHDTADRFLASGKDRFIMLVAGDLDPEGENICETWGACLRDEHGIHDLTVVKVGVNPDQVQEYNLHPLPIKVGSSRADRYKSAHGDAVYELEAFEPVQLQNVISDAIRGVLDLELFEEERRREAEDARHILAYQRVVRQALKGCQLVEGGAA